MGTFCIAQGAHLVPCSDLEWWDDRRGGREIKEGGGVCTHIAGLLHCTVKTYTT